MRKKEGQTSSENSVSMKIQPRVEELGVSAALYDESSVEELRRRYREPLRGASILESKIF